ncbi:5-oxoprolinase subunit B family protein [Aliiruegeria sabulilitoris]|uniref:5-oxoprolinase subunit B family protein n=1 Tax=Aliiruegeria sabulilitoris TaxID=1510458 RepID=UPI00082AEAAE|nr:carboxyltransferase domain-containing protein [Aliiruegeria sabulilitoris]NDR56254.1 allophanate hydrolase subunit 1 [Pseudoruegeria sp. M32A2M]
MKSDQETGFPQISPLGIDGLLVRFADRFDDAANRAALAFRALADAMADVQETSTSLGAVYLRFDPHTLAHADLMDRLRGLLAERNWYDAPLPANHRVWRIPTVYGGAHGPQLDATADLAGTDADSAIEALSTARLRVMAIGFAPGFPYLGQLPERWNLPRHDDLKTAVPPGALCLAIRQCVLFPTQSPTGWRHVGTTAFRSFRPDHDQPFLLQPGDEILFPAAPARDFDRLAEAPNGGASCEPAP